MSCFRVFIFGILQMFIANYLNFVQAVALCHGTTVDTDCCQDDHGVMVLQQPLYALPSLSSIVQQISDCQWVQCVCWSCDQTTLYIRSCDQITPSTFTI